MAARTLPSGMLSFAAMQPGQRANGAASRIDGGHAVAEGLASWRHWGRERFMTASSYFNGSWLSAARAQREPDCTLALYRRQPGWSG
jgi:hypothetical protein